MAEKFVGKKNTPAGIFGQSQILHAGFVVIMPQ